MQLHRVVLTWAGAGVVGNAVTVLHWDGSNQSAPPVAAIKAAMDGLAGCFPVGLQIVTPNTGDTIEDTTGALVGVWSSTQGGTTAGSGSAGSAAGVGACIGWTTGGIVSGSKGPRKLRGRTFLVPLHFQMYDTDGTITGQGLNTLRAGANALQAAGPLAVWHRPSAPGASNGTSYGVLSNRVRDKVAYLSSRRD